MINFGCVSLTGVKNVQMVDETFSLGVFVKMLLKEISIPFYFILKQLYNILFQSVHREKKSHHHQY